MRDAKTIADVDGTLIREIVRRVLSIAKPERIMFCTWTEIGVVLA